MIEERFEEFVHDIYGMPDPQWFSDKWARYVLDWMEKAEKWDLVQDYIIVELKTDPPSFFGKSETLEEFVKMKQKLEAIQTKILSAQNRFSIRGVGIPDADDELKIKFREILNELWEILEANQ